MVFKFLPALLKENNQYKFSACFFENIYWFKRLVQKSHQISALYFLLSYWSIFSSVHGRLSKQYSGSKAAFGTTFRVQEDTGKPEKLSEEVTGWIFTISKGFGRSKKKLNFKSSSQKTTKNCENHQRSYKKCCFNFQDLQKNFISWHYPL